MSLPTLNKYANKNEINGKNEESPAPNKGYT